MSIFSRGGPKTRRIEACLRRRARTRPRERPALDGILHFLMSFDHVVGASLLLTFEDARAVCAGVAALDTTLHRVNRSRREDERFRFSYGSAIQQLRLR